MRAHARARERACGPEIIAHVSLLVARAKLEAKLELLNRLFGQPDIQQAGAPVVLRDEAVRVLRCLLAVIGERHS